MKIDRQHYGSSKQFSLAGMQDACMGKARDKVGEIQILFLFPSTQCLGLQNAIKCYGLLEIFLHP